MCFGQLSSVVKCFPNNRQPASLPSRLCYRTLFFRNAAVVSTRCPLEIEKLIHREIQSLCDLQQASRADATDPALVFMDLLRSDTDLVCERVLGQPSIEAVGSDTLRDQLVDKVRKIGLIPDAQTPLLFGEFIVHDAQARSQKLTGSFCRTGY